MIPCITLFQEPAFILGYYFELEDGNYPQPKQAGAPGSTTADTGIGTRWLVRGGSFKFRISTNFALSNAEWADLDSSNKPKTDTMAIDQTAQLFSKPMRVKQAITSTLKVTITKKVSKDVQGSWQNVAFYMKDRTC